VPNAGESKLRPRKAKGCVSQKDESHDGLMGFDLRCIKCGMGRWGKDLCIKCRIPEVKLAFWRGERKSGKYLDTIPVSGKTPKLRKSPKNKVT